MNSSFSHSECRVAPGGSALAVWRRTVALAVMAVALLMLVSSCGKTKGPAVLATVGKTRITVDDLKNEIERRRQAARPVPDNAALLDEMVEYEALLQRARASGVAQDQQVERELNNLLISKYLERELVPRVEAVEVSDAEVRAEYTNNLARYTTPAKVRLAILFLKGGPLMSDEKRAELNARMEEARRRALENPAPGGRGPAAQGFGALAIDYSDDHSSRFRGGDIGWLDAGNLNYRWPEEVLKTGDALKKGEMSPIITSGNGLYLVLKTDERPMHVTPFETVAGSLRHSVRLEKHRHLERMFHEEAKNLVGVTINGKALATVPPRPKEGAVARRGEAGPPGLPGASTDTQGN